MGLSGSVKMTESKNPGNPEEQDKNTTSYTRPPEWDVSKQIPRKFGFGKSGCEYFEVGKYSPDPDAVKTKAKNPPDFHKTLSRATTVATKQRPPGSDGRPAPADRSRYRHNAIARKGGITHVMDMTKDTDRPPLLPKTKHVYDENDPEVCRMVYERAMSFDADTVGRAVEHRRDFCLDLNKSLSREDAGRGNRNTKPAYTGGDDSGEETSVEKMKDSVRIYRGDLGMTFDQHKYRNQTRHNAEYSSLQRPRSQAAPDFARTVPAEGFSARTPVKIMPRARSHDAMPGWNVEAVDGLMTM